MARARVFRCLLAALVLGSFLIPPAQAKDKADTATYQTDFESWRAADRAFDGWSLTGTALSDGGELQLGPGATAETDPYAPGAYYGGSFYNGGAYLVGEAEGPVVEPGFAWTEATASWNAETPPGTWIETLISAQVGGRWTKWYNLGVWAADYSTVRRHSVRLQGDADGYVAVDTLVISARGGASAYQLRFRLFASEGNISTPSIRNASVVASTTAGKIRSLEPGNPALWNTLLAVPECSQMVYPDGGNVWCSPTSTSMVLGYWGADPGPCEQRVRKAVDGVYDWIYDGHGNWPFNAAYAATKDLEAYVTRFTSLAEIEPWVAAGVPVVISFAWKKGQLTGAAIPSSSGHLAVVVGFDANGNPVVNDPAAAADADVQRTYNRGELETVWLEASGGVAYLIYPSGWSVPAP